MESNFSNTDAIAALHADDPHLFRPFVEHFQHPLFGFLGRMGFSQSDAEDLAQEVFLKAWRYRASYSPDKAQPSTWLFTIARNTAIDRLKKNAGYSLSHGDAEIPAEPTPHPEHQLQQCQSQQQLAIAIRQLPINDRCAIALFYMNDLSVAQAASVMQCSDTAFKTRLSRARSKLKAILQAMDEFNER
ncbi:MAG: RNA polymerase sigma factor [Pseudomonadota bacterium]